MDFVTFAEGTEILNVILKKKTACVGGFQHEGLKKFKNSSGLSWTEPYQCTLPGRSYRLLSYSSARCVASLQ
jgi:hypothetical protein